MFSVRETLCVEESPHVQHSVIGAQSPNSVKQSTFPTNEDPSAESNITQQEYDNMDFIQFHLHDYLEGEQHEHDSVLQEDFCAYPPNEDAFAQSDLEYGLYEDPLLTYNFMAHLVHSDCSPQSCRFLKKDGTTSTCTQDVHTNTKHNRHDMITNTLNELATANGTVDLNQCFTICDHITKTPGSCEIQHEGEMNYNKTVHVVESSTEIQSDIDQQASTESVNTEKPDHDDLLRQSQQDGTAPQHDFVMVSNLEIKSQDHLNDFHNHYYMYHDIAQNDEAKVTVTHNGDSLRKFLKESMLHEVPFQRHILEDTKHLIHLNQLTSQNYLTSVHAVYLTGHETNVAWLHNTPYQKLSYDKHNVIYGTINDTVVPVMIDNGASMTLMPYHFYEQCTKLHSLPKTEVEGVRIFTGNVYIQTHFVLDLTLDLRGLRMAL